MSARREYPASLASEARTMSAGGWSGHAIHGVFVARLGDYAPNRATVYRWLDINGNHAAAERRRMARLTAQKASFTFPPRSPEWVEAFVCRLSAQGLKYASVAKVTQVVLDRPVSREMVREIVSRHPSARLAANAAPTTERVAA